MFHMPPVVKHIVVPQNGQYIYKYKFYMMYVQNPTKTLNGYVFKYSKYKNICTTEENYITMKVKGVIQNNRTN